MCYSIPFAVYWGVDDKFFCFEILFYFSGMSLLYNNIRIDMYEYNIDFGLYS